MIRWESLKKKLIPWLLNKYINMIYDLKYVLKKVINERNDVIMVGNLGMISFNIVEKLCRLRYKSCKVSINPLTLI